MLPEQGSHPTPVGGLGRLSQGGIGKDVLQHQRVDVEERRLEDPQAQDVGGGGHPTRAGIAPIRDVAAGIRRDRLSLGSFRGPGLLLRCAGCGVA